LKTLVRLPIFETHDIPTASPRVRACVCVITAMCLHIPALCRTSTHSRCPNTEMPTSVALETGSRPVTKGVCRPRPCKHCCSHVVMEKWTLFACYVFVPIFNTAFPLLCVCVCDHSCDACACVCVRERESERETERGGERDMKRERGREREWSKRQRE